MSASLGNEGGATLVPRLTYTLDCCDAEKLATFWSEVLGYSLLGRSGSFWPLIPPEGVEEPWLVLQQVDERKSGKNRMHLDIHVADLDEDARRYEALGARRLSDEPVVMGSFSWLVMADPEGNEFCIVQPGDQ
jgi:predicted enzyme related to lactoylglutathione lyase